MRINSKHLLQLFPKVLFRNKWRKEINGYLDHPDSSGKLLWKWYICMCVTVQTVHYAIVLYNGKKQWYLWLATLCYNDNKKIFTRNNNINYTILHGKQQEWYVTESEATEVKTAMGLCYNLKLILSLWLVKNSLRHTKISRKVQKHK